MGSEKFFSNIREKSVNFGILNVWVLRKIVNLSDDSQYVTENHTPIRGLGLSNDLTPLTAFLESISTLSEILNLFERTFFELKDSFSIWKSIYQANRIFLILQNICEIKRNFCQINSLSILQLECEFRNNIFQCCRNFHKIDI